MLIFTFIIFMYKIKQKVRISLGPLLHFQVKHFYNTLINKNIYNLFCSNFRGLWRHLEKIRMKGMNTTYTATPTPSITTANLGLIGIEIKI